MDATTAEKIRERIAQCEPGAVVTAPDFLDLGGKAAVYQALSRLARDGEIRRIAIGLYHVPVIDRLSGQPVPPALEEIASAVARRTGAEMQITGVGAANALNLSDQTPARNVFITNGTARKVRIGSEYLEFRHAAPSRIHVAARQAGPTIEALRYLGRQNITADVIEQLRSDLTDADKAALHQEISDVPAWLRPILEQIAAP